MNFYQKFSKIINVSLIILIVFVVAVFYSYNEHNVLVQNGLEYSNSIEAEKVSALLKLVSSSGLYNIPGDLTLNADNKIRIKNNTIDSEDIINKSIKNKDISAEAIDSRAIKNGSITDNDIHADGESGFLKNTHDGLSWDNLILSDIAIPTIGNPIEMTNLDAAFSYIWSAGIFSGGDITDNGDGSVNISNGEAMLRTFASDKAPLKSLNFPGRSNISMVNDATNYLWVNYNNGNPQVETSTTSTDYNCLEKCHLYTIVRDGTELAILDGREQNVDSNRKLRRKNYETDPFTHVTG